MSNNDLYPIFIVFEFRYNPPACLNLTRKSGFSFVLAVNIDNKIFIIEKKNSFARIVLYLKIEIHSAVNLRYFTSFLLHSFCL